MSRSSNRIDNRGFLPTTKVRMSENDVNVYKQETSLRPFYGRLHGVKFSYSLNSDLSTQYLITEMLCIE